MKGMHYNFYQIAKSKHSTQTRRVGECGVFDALAKNSKLIAHKVTHENRQDFTTRELNIRQLYGVEDNIYCTITSFLFMLIFGGGFVDVDFKRS